MNLANYTATKWTLNDQKPKPTVINFYKDITKAGRFKGTVILGNADISQTYAYKVRINGHNCMSVRPGPVGWVYPSSKRTLILQITHPNPESLRIEIGAIKVMNQFVQLTSGSPRMYFKNTARDVSDKIKVVTKVNVIDMKTETKLDKSEENISALQSVASNTMVDNRELQIRHHQHGHHYNIDRVQPIEIIKDFLALSTSTVEETLRSEVEEVRCRIMPWYIPCLVAVVFSVSFSLGYNADHILQYYYKAK